MTNEILIALIAKDAYELNRIFSDCDTSQLTSAYMQMAVDKAKEMTANLETLVNRQTADVKEETVNGSDAVTVGLSSDEIRAQIKTDIETFVSEHITNVLKNCVATEMTGYISTFSEKETSFRTEVAEANHTLYAYIQNINAELTDSVQRLANSITSLSDEFVALKEFAESTLASKQQEEVSQSADEPLLMPEMEIETTAIEQESAIESNALEHEVVKQDITDNALTGQKITYQREPQTVNEQPAASAEPQPTVIDAPHAERPIQSVVNIADSVVAKTTVAESIHTRESILDKLANRKDNSLASTLSNTKIDDLKSAISIADRFRFQRELFEGDGERMNKTLSIFNSYKSMADAEDYIKKNLNWPSESPTVADFLHLLQRRYL